MPLLDASIWAGNLYIDGWTPGSGDVRNIVSPSTSEELGSISLASVRDVKRASERAAVAQRDWAARTPEERAAVLRKAGLLWEQHGEEVQGWLMREAGSIRAKAELETRTAANECFEASALPTYP